MGYYFFAEYKIYYDPDDETNWFSNKVKRYSYFIIPEFIMILIIITLYAIINSTFEK